jgi:hypothetical protein
LIREALALIDAHAEHCEASNNDDENREWDELEELVGEWLKRRLCRLKVVGDAIQHYKELKNTLNAALDRDGLGRVGLPSVGELCFGC